MSRENISAGAQIVRAVRGGPRRLTAEWQATMSVANCGGSGGNRGHDWSVVKPSKADRMMDTRSIDGRFSDRDLFEFAIKASESNH